MGKWNQRFKWSLLVVGVSLPLVLLAQEVDSQENREQEVAIDVGQVSKEFGFMLGKNLQGIRVDFDIEQLIEGLRAANTDGGMVIDPSELIEQISQLEQRGLAKLAKQNLERADRFMADQVKKKGMVKLEEGRLLYQIDQKGTGSVVEEGFTPQMTYQGRTLDGDIFSESVQESGMSLRDLIPGLRDAIVGMQEGEVRKIYIHPDLAYGSAANGSLDPNSLLIFDVTIHKADLSEDSQEETSDLGSHARDES